MQRISSWLIKLLRMIPPGTQGKTRLSKFLIRRYLLDGLTLVVDRDKRFLLVPSLREPIAFYLLVDGVYEPDLQQLIVTTLKPGGVFVDVGANIGFFSLTAAQAVGPGGLVIAVEPSPRIASCLGQNLLLNKTVNVQIENCALFDQDLDAINFYAPPDDHFGMGSLAPQFYVSPTNIRAMRLDTILRNRHLQAVNMLKVDVEGFEAAVFRGATTLLTGCNPPLVVFEFSDWAEKRSGFHVGTAQRVLMDLGYHLWTLDRYMCNGKPLTMPLTTGSTMLVATRNY